MALHGNKSQSARTQALSGFKSGDLRALVATDIAARGIDIDELPHVVNYEIPNVPEDYVHRIGRTGRAGREGQAISFVCLDEEGFMQEIERFTKQQIAVEKLDGFGPEDGEQAEPIAMGRQTLWGGAGRPPSRDVMQAAARNARQEMMQRIRDNKGRQASPRGAAGKDGAPGEAAAARRHPQPARAEHGPEGGAGNGRRRRRGGAGQGGGNGAARAPQPHATHHHHAHEGGAREERQPRNHGNSMSPTQADAVAHRRAEAGAGYGAGPDPLRTSVDSFGGRGRRGGGGGGGGGGGYGRRNGGGGGGGGRSGGGFR